MLRLISAALTREVTERVEMRRSIGAASDRKQKNPKIIRNATSSAAERARLRMDNTEGHFKQQAQITNEIKLLCS
jgi:hypothetical protein